LSFFIQLKRYTLTNLFFSWFNLAKLVININIYYFQIKKTQYNNPSKKKLSVTTIVHHSTAIPPPIHHLSITAPPPQSFKLIFTRVEVVFTQIEVLQKARSWVLVEFVQARGLFSSDLWSFTLWFVSFMILVCEFYLSGSHVIICPFHIKQTL